MLISYRRSQTSIILRVKILNSSVSTGAGLTGLTFSSSGLRIGTIADNEATTTAYTQGGSTIETITTLGTYAAPTATKCRFKEVDATSHPGVYEIQLADARFAVSSAKSLLVSISGATNLAETDACVPLTDIDPYDTVRAGLTALPNAAAAAANGLWILGSNNTAAITIGNLTTGAIAGTTLTFSGAVAFQSTFTVTGATTLTGAVTASNASNNIVGISIAAVATAGATAIRGAIGLATANLDTQLAAIAGYIDTEVGAIKAKTDQFVFTIAGQVDANALSGGGGLDAAGVRGAIGLATANMDTQLANILAASGGSGGGSISWPITINDGVNPLDGAAVWITTDIAGSNIVAGTLFTNAFGVANFLLDAGTYYVWAQHARYNGTNPTLIVVA